MVRDVDRHRRRAGDREGDGLQPLGGGADARGVERLARGGRFDDVGVLVQRHETGKLGSVGDDLLLGRV